MELQELKNFTITANTELGFMEGSSGILFQPKFKITQDGEELPLYMQARCRMERYVKSRKEAIAARNAISGAPASTTANDSMPFYDIHLIDSKNEDKSLIVIDDVDALIVNMPPPEKYRVQYRLNIDDKEITELDMEGVDSWRLSALDEDGEKKVGFIEAKQKWLFNFLQWLFFLLPKEWVRMIPFDITDILGLKYNITYKGKTLGKLQSDKKVINKSSTINIIDGLSKEEHQLAIGMGILMSYYIARSFYKIDEALDRYSHFD